MSESLCFQVQSELQGLKSSRDEEAECFNQKEIKYRENILMLEKSRDEIELYLKRQITLLSKEKQSMETELRGQIASISSDMNK